MTDRMQRTRPRLATRRLVLRPLRPRHAVEVFDAIVESRRSLGRWLPFVQSTRAASDTEVFIRRASRSEHDIVWGIWRLPSEPAGVGPAGNRRRLGRIAAGGESYCGSVGLHRILREQAVGTLGYWNRRRCEGQGIVTEAVAAVILWAAGPLGLERIAVEAATGNAASLRVIEKLGFVREGVLRDAQRIPGRRARVDWVISSLVRADLSRVRPGLVRLCGTPRPWEG
ncbi:MAG: GNAT family protein [Candidatus Eisenbacteria bacterium]